MAGQKTTKTLVITEKPSVAQAAARTLGATERRDGFLEGESHIVSWCFGHLVGLSAADCYDGRYSKWAKEDLPIFPEPWQYTVKPSARKQFGILKGLMERADVAGIVNACDAGREGELIFRLAYRQAGCRKPFMRLWISSMEESAIREGFAGLKPGEDYDSLYEAALCRAKADWLVGINATRLFTTLHGGKTLNVGRVMTPTLALLTEREEAAAGFKKEKFYAVEITCGGFLAASGRFKSRTDAGKLRKACIGKSATVKSAVRKEKQEKPPKLYDLTALQREANRIFGYTAQQTLDCLQALYEKRLATYPRTDSRHLTEDVAETLPALCAAVSGAFPFASGFPGEVNAAQVTDAAKVSDHHAILPTAGVAREDLAALPTGERNVLALVSARLLCAVCPERHIYADTEILLECAGAEFTAKGRTELAAGWKALESAFLAAYGKKQGKKDVKASGRTEPLPELAEGQALTAEEAALREGATSPPQRYTEDTLLAAMENAGAEDFADVPDAERKGLGTPATRAGVIEKLVKGGFVERKGRQLVPTGQGMELAKTLPDSVKSAKLTAEWETALKRVERGELPPDEFLDGIKGMVQGLIDGYRDVEASASDAFAKPGPKPVGNCPRCGRPVYEGKKSFYCSGYKADPPCGFALWKDNPYFKSKRRELTEKVAAALLKDGKAEMTGLYSEKKGVVYDATVVMEDTSGKYVNFRLEFPPKKSGGDAKKDRGDAPCRKA